jgi:integrase
MATMVMLDCGLRPSECLSLRISDIDLDSLLIQVMCGVAGRERCRSA